MRRFHSVYYDTSHGGLILSWLGGGTCFIHNDRSERMLVFRCLRYLVKIGKMTIRQGLAHPDDIVWDRPPV